VAIYKQIEVPLYGSDRVGEYKPGKVIDTIEFIVGEMKNIALPYEDLVQMDSVEAVFVRELGKKEYELKDHLGNVRVVVSDVKEASETRGEIIGLNAKPIASMNY